MTRMCGARESDSRRPSRTTSWSSTIRQVISDFPSALGVFGHGPRIVFRESDREGELLRLGLGLEGPNPAVGDAELACQSGHAPLHRLDVVGAKVGAAAVELARTSARAPASPAARCSRKCSRVPGRRKSRFVQTPVAPASRAALTTSASCAGSIGDAGQDRRHADAGLDAGVDELRDGLQPLPRMRGRGLGLPPDLVVERRDRRRSPRRSARAGGLDEDVDVADDHRPARDDAERVAGLGERLDAGAGQAVAPFGGLVGVGGGADRDRLRVPRTAGRARGGGLRRR